MESPAEYHLSPPAAPSALLSAERLAVLADALAEERQGCDSEPANPLGFWPAAVAALLGHDEAVQRKHASDIAWLISQIQLRDKELDEAGARALKAEARVKEERADAARFQVQVLSLVRRELDLMKEIAELKGQCVKCGRKVNAYGQCLHCDTTEAGLCN